MDFQNIQGQSAFTVRGRGMKKPLLLTIVILLTATTCALGVVWPDPNGYAANLLIVKFRQPIADTVEEQVKANVPPGQVKLSKTLDDLSARYKVKVIEPLFKNFKQNRHHLNALQTKSSSLLTEKENRILKRLKRAPKGAQVPALDRIYKVQVELDTGQSLEDVVAAYNNDPGVEYAEPDYIVSICKTPNDPLYPIQWPLNNIGQKYPQSRFASVAGTSDCDIDAPEGWDIYTGDSQVIVAVVDSGADYAHRDLHNNMWVNVAELGGTSGVDDDGNGYVDDIYGYDFCTYEGKTRDSDPKDDNGHGTHCAGIIAAQGNNGLDVAGVCWDARIMALKFLGSDASGLISDAAASFYYAVENGADIISNSWGSKKYSAVMQEAIDYAYGQGLVIVAAAGNRGDTVPYYPAYYDHVISVAATNSNDVRVSFSSYGDWVDMAAPGVDVLSLRAAGTAVGSIYDTYTTIASGTSMACPHVAAACAILLSAYPGINVLELEQILMNSTDPTTPSTCKSGRLNLHKALLQIIDPNGTLLLDRSAYMCTATATALVWDLNLVGAGTHSVVFTTNGGDSETLVLAQRGPSPASFAASVPLSAAEVIPGDGALQVSHGQFITATYTDANDGTGKPVTRTDTAVVDCQGPAVSRVQVSGLIRREAIITIETDEPTITQIRCGLTCGGPYTIEQRDIELGTSHSFQLFSLADERNYYFVIDLTDAAGNTTTADNEGLCYSFTTPKFQGFLVPSVYPTIQAAIDAASNGNTIIISPGMYKGPGNRDIRFKDKKITVRGTDPNDPNIVSATIIDCNGTELEPHRGFYFGSIGEAESVLSGLTIKNGYAYSYGGAICCDGLTSPTITNCIITSNFADGFGGGIFSEGGSVTVNGCTITDNTCNWRGGGICALYGYPTMTNCTISDNSVIYGGGGIFSEYACLQISNCTITGNSAEYGGGAGIYSESGSPLLLTGCSITANSAEEGCGGGISWCGNAQISNCTVTENSARWGAGIFCGGEGTISNCSITGNSGSEDGAGIFWFGDLTVTNSLISGNRLKFAGGGSGGGIYYQSHVLTIINCTVTENIAPSQGGGISVSNADKVLISNSVFWGNQSPVGQEMYLDLYYPCATSVSYTDVQGGKDGVAITPGRTINWGPGNINADPCFVQLGHWADANDPNIPAEPNDPNAVWVDGNYHLLDGSPCINAGNPNYVLLPGETDLDSQPRILLGRIDMGAYEFNYIPVANAGPDQTVYANSNCTAQVTLDGSASYDPDGDQLTYTWTWNDQIIPPTGGDGIINMLDFAALTEQWLQDKDSLPDLSALTKAWLSTPDSPNWNPQCDVAPAGPTATINLPIGQHHIKLVVNDGIENSQPDEVMITVLDNTPPEFTLSVTPATLWPQDHKMVRITPSWTLTDNCDQSPQVTLVGITSNELDDDKGDGNTTGDIEVRDDGSIYLRAERSGTDLGRIYTITYQAADNSGNTAISSATVTVPHDQSRQ